jgi:glycerophosphoryl diester phosphodiesterase
MDTQGHRGCRGLLPENSLPAFEKAINLGVSTLELDLAISKDHQLVVSHEPFMNHEIALDPQGSEIAEIDEKNHNLYSMNYDSIRLYDVGSKIHPRFLKQEKIKVHKPLLSELFEMAETLTAGRIKYNIEIKSLPEYDGVFSPKVPEFVKLLMQEIRKAGVVNRTTIQSFDIRALEEMRQQHPEMELSLLVDENENIDDKLNSLSFQPAVISPYFELLTAKNVKAYQSKGYKILPWTVNTKQEIQLMLAYGVDGIISDYPDMLLQVVQAQNNPE